MLLNPARADRMQPNGKQKREHQIKKSGPTAEIDDRYVVRDRTPEIQREPTVPHLNCLEPRRTSDLKKWKQHQPDRLSIPFVTHQARLPVVRQIGVPVIVAL